SSTARRSRPKPRPSISTKARAGFPRTVRCRSRFPALSAAPRWPCRSTAPNHSPMSSRRPSKSRSRVFQSPMPWRAVSPAAAPIRTNYRGIDVYECPPNSQGFVMLEALNILEGFNLKEMGHNSAPYLHAVTEALKLSFADRNKYVGDPKFVPNIPMQALLSK